jgi:solute carrier family 13 (sodium-dependent dicarboxylate transporter), member 2/3/5
VILGFLLATAFLSMWISNTATTVVMLPIVTSVIKLLVNDADGFTKNDRNFALSITLGIAYAASAGGMATIIGTPPNSVAVGFMEKEYQRTISFLDWMIVGLPFSLLMLGAVYIVLVKWLFPNNLERLQGSGNIIKEELAKLGPMKKIEKQVLLIFITTILLWIFRININEWLPGLELTDTGISMLAAFALFCIPLRFGTSEFIIDWDDTVKLPWGILILFGGGLALASALSEAKVIEYIGDLVSRNKAFTTFTVAALLIIISVFFTELISNVAMVAIFAPVVAGIAIGLGMDILHLLIPMTIASSCGFMLPMSTPPNAIVFASGHIKVKDMARAGFILNVISILLLMVFYGVVIPRVF